MKRSLAVFGLLLVLVGTLFGADGDVLAEAERQRQGGLFLGAVFGRAGGWQACLGRQGPEQTDRAVSAATRFDVASVTKTITAAVCASLYAEGKLDPDKPFTDYLPEHVLAKENCRITVRDLAVHASGFGYYGKRRYSPDPKVNGGKDGYLADIYAFRPTLPYGTFSYSCYNYVLLGLIAERLGGQPLDVLARERIFRPLGMTHTCWWPVADDGTVVRTPLVQEDGLKRKIGEVLDPPAFYAGLPVGNAGVYSTLDDLLRFTGDLLARKAFPAKYYELLETPTFDRDGERRSFGFDMGPTWRPAGFSEKAFFHSGFTGQTIAVDPATGFAGAVLTVRSGDWRKAFEGRNRLLARMASPAAGPRCPMGDGYVLVDAASDEFDGPRLDTVKWMPWNPTFPGRSAGFLFASDNVKVADGKAVLTARLLREDEKTPENLLRGYDTYATGTIKSHAKIRYGYFECRAKTMRANVCNAFWLYDPHSGDRWAKGTAGDVSEEIDIFELTSRKDYRGEYDCANIVYNTLHAYKTPYLEGVVSIYKEKIENHYGERKMPYDFCDGFHTFGLLWTPEELVWFCDGKETFRHRNDYYHRPLHVTFDSEIMYDWFGIPDPKDLPATFEIDYVRVWQKKAEAPRNPSGAPKADEWKLAGKGGAKDIVLVSPREGEVVSLVNDDLRAYFAKPRAERERLFTNATYRTEMARWAFVDKPVKLRWLWCGHYNPMLTVEVFAPDGKCVFTGRTAAPEIDVPNLEIGRRYRWRVSGHPALRAEPIEGTFVTADDAPRALRFPHVYNLRDLGGRIGLNGRRVKQGLVYRSGGLNDNAITFDREEKDWIPGEGRMTADERDAFLSFTGLKTDLDLRNERECFGMTGSPLGPSVTWTECSSWAYGELGEQKGKDRFVPVFKVFLDKKNYPIDFHCITGADRTGTVAFILNALLGVGLEDLYRDWEATALYSTRMDFYHSRRLDKLVAVIQSYAGATLADKTACFVKDCGFTDADIAFVREFLLEK